MAFMHHNIELSFDKATEDALNLLREKLMHEGYIKSLPEGIPHISLSSFDQGNIESWENFLSEISAINCFNVELAHIGIFTTDDLVAYMGVTPSENINALHFSVHKYATKVSYNLYEHYIPNRIIYHSTLAESIEKQHIGDLIKFLCHSTLPRRAKICRISLVEYSPYKVLVSREFSS